MTDSLAGARATKYEQYLPPSRIKDADLREAGQRRIVIAAIDLFQRKGFHDTSVEEIADASSLTVGALYKYVRSKHDVLFLCVKYITDQVEDATFSAEDPDPIAWVRKTIDAYVRAMDQHRRSILMNYREAGNLSRPARLSLFAFQQDLRSRFFTRLHSIPSVKGKSGEMITVVADNIILLGQMWAVNHRVYADYLTLEQFIETQTELVLRGLGIDASKGY